MKEFNQLCKQLEELDADSYRAFLNELAERVIPELMETTIEIDGMAFNGVDALADFIVASVVADGKLTEEEYLLALPLFADFFGDYMDYEELREIIRSLKAENRVLLEGADCMVDLFGALNDDLKDSIIMICLLVCAADGKISHAEKSWVKRLIQ